jgi:peroxiredoxin
VSRVRARVSGIDWRSVALIGLLAAAAPAACSQWELRGRTSAMEDVWVGKMSPDLAFTTLDGENVRLGDLRGRRVLLTFWATWCLPCRFEMPALDGLLRERPDDGALAFGISNESETVIRAFAAENDIRFPLASVPDRALPAPYNHIPAVPATFVIDREGRIEAMHFGLVGEGTLAQALDGPGDATGRP